METVSSELRACDNSNKIVSCCTGASNFAKAATDNPFEGEITHPDVANNFEDESVGICKAFPLCESRTECEDPTEDFFKKPPCPVFGCEACSCHVRPPSRISAEKDENGNTIATYGIRDFELKGGNLFDGCKAKGITYRASVKDVTEAKICSHDCSPIAFNFEVDEEKFPIDPSNFDLSAEVIVHREFLTVESLVGDCTQSECSVHPISDSKSIILGVFASNCIAISKDLKQSGTPEERKEKSDERKAQDGKQVLVRSNVVVVLS